MLEFSKVHIRGCAGACHGTDKVAIGSIVLEKSQRSNG